MAAPGTPGIHLCRLFVTQAFLSPRGAFSVLIIAFPPIHILSVNRPYITKHCKQIEHLISLDSAFERSIEQLSIECHKSRPKMIILGKHTSEPIIGGIFLYSRFEN